MYNLYLSKSGDIVRRCRVCGCRSDQVKFVVMKDSKTGRRYVHNICHPCRVEKNRETRARRLAKNPKYDIERAAKWNNENRDRYNKNRRLNHRKKRGYSFDWTRADYAY